MSNLVEQIITAAESRIESTLSGYSSLRYYYDISKNDYKGNQNRFAVIPKAASDQDGVTRSITLNHEFQIVLTDGYVNGPKSDDNLQSVIKSLYDKMDDVMTDLFLNKMGLPSIVLLTTVNGIEEPEVLVEDKVVILRMNINVRYRRNI